MKFPHVLTLSTASASPPAREVWIEITDTSSASKFWMSPPAREVWIEILNFNSYNDSRRTVTSREGGVD